MSSRRIINKRVVKAYWKCSYCDSKADGLTDYCPNCGVHKPDSTQYKLDKNNIVEATDKELEEAGMKRENCDGKHPDWKCSYCNSLNNWADTNCSSCGSLKEDATQDYFGSITPKNKNNNQRIKEENTYTNTTTNYTASQEMNFSFQKLVSNINFSKVITVFGVVTFISILVFLLAPYKVQAEVTGFSWNRNIYIEEMKTVKESDWTIPSGARVYDTKEEVYDTEKVIDHYEEVKVTKTKQEIVDYSISTEYEYSDNGDGTYTEYEVEVKTPIYANVEYETTEQVPVYKDVDIIKTKYYYEIDKWFNKYTKSSSGTDKNPYWNNDYTLGFNQRDTRKSENYYIHYNNNDEKASNYNEWMQTEIGDSVTITKCRLGIVYNQSVNQ